MKRFLVVSSLLLSFSCTAANIYTWTDENGVVHYSHQSPKGIEATIISSADIEPTKIGTNSPTRKSAPTQPESELAKSATIIKQQDAKQAKDICDNARHSLDMLNSYNRLTRTDPKTGQVVTMTDEDKVAAKADNEERIRLFCDK